MSTSVTFNGTSYTLPAIADASWGTNVSNYLIAISTGCLQKTGGTFTLTAEVNFGATYGIKAAYLKSQTTNIAAAGFLALAKTDTVSWRNNANSADLALAVDSSNRLTFNGVVLETAGVGSIVNADISASAAIDFSKLATLTSGNILVGSAGGVATSVAMSGDATMVASGAVSIGASKVTNTMLAGSIAYSKLSLTGAILNADLAGSIAYSKLSLTGAILNADLAAAVSIAKGGTGQITAALGYAALSPLTTKGDLQTYSTTTARLGVGADGKVLTADSGQTTGLAWTSPLTNPMTTAGDIITGGVSGAANRLAIGAEGKHLLVASSTSAWSWQEKVTATSSSYNAASFNTDGTSTLNVTTGSSTITVTLPDASAQSGRKITIKKVDSGSGKITIATTSSQTIDGWTTSDMGAGAICQYAYITVVSNGTNWNVQGTGGDQVQVITGTASAMVTDTAKDMCSLSIPAGIWSVVAYGDVTGMTASTVTGSQMIVSLSTTTGTLNSARGFSASILLDSTSHVTQFQDGQLSTSPQNIRLTAATTYYAVARAKFASGTVTADGAIFATRVC